MKANMLAYIIKSPHIYRQIFATMAASMLTLSTGIVFGSTAVLLPQLKTDKNYPYDKAFESWIAAISPLAMIVGCIFSGAISDGIGRKSGQLSIISPFIIGWCIMGFANNNTLMLIGRFITGLCAGASRSSSLVYIGEIVNPKFRATALYVPSLAVQLGVLISHVGGKYVHWKITCFLSTIPNILALLVLLFLYESPLWLLSKGKIDKGKDSFILYRGNDESSEKELTLILKRCSEKLNRTSFIDIMNLIFSKAFTRSLLTIFFLFVAVQWSGINTLAFYAQDIFERTFAGGVDPYLLMIAMDCLRIIAAAIMCILVKILPRRVTFTIACFISSFSLIALTIYLYIQPVGLIWVAVTFMLVYIGTTTILPSIAWSFVIEIFPSQIRGFGSGLSSATSFILLFVSVIVTPEIRENYGETSMFISFAVVTLVTGVLLYFLIPDTNGKTLQAIEDVLYKKEKNVQSNNNIVVHL